MSALLSTLVLHKWERCDLLDGIFDLVPLLSDRVQVVRQLLRLLGTLVDLEVLMRKVLAVSVQLFNLCLFALYVRL